MIITQALFLLLDSWRGRRVPAPAQPQSKLHKPGGLSAKRSSFCTKNTDIVYRLPPGSPQGSGLACSQPAAAAAQDLMPGARLGLTRDGSWQGTVLPCTSSFPCPWILQWDGEGPPSCSLLLCSRGTGTRCHQPTRLVSTHQYALTPSIAPSLRDAHQPPSHLWAHQAASRAAQRPTGSLQPHHQTTDTPQLGQATLQSLLLQRQGSDLTSGIAHAG